MTEQDFCELVSSYWGEKTTNISQLTQINLTGKELKEFVDFVIEKRLHEIRTAFADYYVSEGCSCCQNIPKHEEAEKRLAYLLVIKPYEDLSGFDFGQYASEKK